MVAILDRSLGEVLAEIDHTCSRGGPTFMRRMVPHVRAPVRYLIYLRFARYLLWEFRWPLCVFTVLVAGRGLDPPPVLSGTTVRSELCPGVPRGVPADLPRVVARVSGRVVSPALVLPAAHRGPGGDRRLGRAARVPGLHAQAKPAGVESHARLALPQPFRRDRGRKGRLPGHQAASRDARDRRRDRDGQRLTAPGRALRQGRSRRPGKRPDGVGARASGRAQGTRRSSSPPATT